MNLLSCAAPAFGIRLPSLSPLSLACVKKKQLLRLLLLGDTRSFLARARDNGDNGPLAANYRQLLPSASVSRGTDITDRGGRLMGKRSNFERREADFYPTPRAAVLPLIPYLRGIRTFAEPCAGDGASGPASGILRPALRLCRRHPHRPGCACARPLRRGRCDHHESALHRAS